MRASGWDGFAATADSLRADSSWTVFDIPCGHDIPIDRPDELMATLEACV